VKDIYVRQGVAAVVVEIGRVDIKDKFAVVGGIRLQAAHGNGSSGFQLGEQVSAAGGWIFEVDVPCGALWDNVRIPIAVLFTLIVLLGVADGLVRNGEISDACAVNAIVSCRGHPFFQGSEEGDGGWRCTSSPQGRGRLCSRWACPWWSG